MKKSRILIGITVIISAIIMTSAACFAAATTAPASKSGSSQSTSTSNSSKTSGSVNSNSTNSNSTNSNSSSSSGSSKTSSSSTKATSTPQVTASPAATTAVVTAAPAAASDSGNTSSGGMSGFWWFLISVIVNTIIVFVVSNRFYKLSCKNNSSSAEIRALRRDIEEKFIKNIDSVSEKEEDITNSNDDYFSPELRGNFRNEAGTEEKDESFRKWEEKMASERKARQIKRNTESVADEKPQGPEDDAVTGETIRVDTGYRGRQEMKNGMSAGSDSDKSEEDTGKQSGVKSKAKEFMNDIFPFKED